MDRGEPWRDQTASRWRGQTAPAPGRRKLSRPHARHEYMPIMVGTIGHWIDRDHACRSGIIFPVKEQQLYAGSVPRKDAEIDTIGKDRCSQRIAPPSASQHGSLRPHDLHNPRLCFDRSFTCRQRYSAVPTEQFAFGLVPCLCSPKRLMPAATEIFHFLLLLSWDGTPYLLFVSFVPHESSRLRKY